MKTKRFLQAGVRSRVNCCVGNRGREMKCKRGFTLRPVNELFERGQGVSWVLAWMKEGTY